MWTLLKNTIKPLYYYLLDRKFREYYRLLSKYSTDKRYKPRSIRILNYKIDVVDSISVIHQFKEIFLDKSYLFAAKKDNPVIYDCGANVGLSCLYFHSLYPNASIEAFEADPEVFRVLESNIRRNAPHSNIKLHNKAIWTSNDGVQFHQEGSDGGTLMSKNSGDNTVTVQSLRLKDLLRKQTPDFLKMDIEGAELDVLMDCAGDLRAIPFIFVEYHSPADSSQKLHLLLELLNKNDFRYHIQSIIDFKSPFNLPWKGQTFDLQLNIYCYKQSS